MATPRLCSIPGCGNRHHAREWCWTHYARWKKHGDPLARRPIAARGAPAQYFEERVLTYDGNECLIWPFARTAGYGILVVDGTARIVSRLVCEFFNGPPPAADYEAAHSCGNGNKGCVTRRHVSWKTPKENAADKKLHGTQTYGETHAPAKLTDDKVHAIRALAKSIKSPDIARYYGVADTTIRHILNGRTWRHIK